MKGTAVRLVAATFGVPALTLGAGAMLRASWSDRLPETVASHWGTSGADAGWSLTAFTGWTFGIGAVLTLAGVVLVAVALVRGYAVPRSAVAFAAWAATLPVGCLVGSMWATLDVPSWEQASSATGALVWAVGLSVGAGVLAALVGGPTVPARRSDIADIGDLTAPAPSDPAPSDSAPSVSTPSGGLASGAPGVWVGGGTNYPLALGVAIALPLVLVLLALSGVGPPAEVAIASAVIALLAALATCRVTVRVDTSGVTVRMGMFSFPQRHIRLGEITSAGVERLTAWSGGGFGVRSNPVADYTAFKVRGGPALSVRLESGHRILATVDHPESAARLVTALKDTEAR